MKHAATPSTPRSASLRAQGAALGSRRALLRVAWLALAALVGVLFTVNLWFLYGELQQPCQTPACLRDIFYLTGDELIALRAQGYDASMYAGAQAGLYLVFSLIHAVLATLIFWRRARDRMARFAAVAMLIWSGTFPSIAHSLWDSLPAAALALLLGAAAGGVCFTVFVFVFPDGRFVPSWTKWLAAVFAVRGLAGTISSSYGTELPWLVALREQTELLFTVAFVGSVSGAQLYRYRKVSNTVARQQTRWVLFGIVAGLTLILCVFVTTSIINPALGRGALGKVMVNALVYAGFLLVPLSIGMSILRARLWDIDLLINRALVYGALTACVVAIYVFVVGYLGAVFRTESNLAISLVATAVVAVAFQPLRQRLQRAANRWLYGDRDDPYAVLSRLGQQLGATRAPDELLHATVSSIRDALKLPYVAIGVHAEPGRAHGDARPAAERAWSIVAASGTPPAGNDVVLGKSETTDALTTLPLSYHGEPLGFLLVAPRAPHEPFGRADRKLLDDLARQAGFAVHAVRLTLDLRRSREQIIAAIEEERRRLRRDLHDGLGPVLATLVVQLEAARELVAADPDAADVLLADATGQAQGAIGDIRRLVYALRPPALDDLGLVGALRAHAARQARAQLELRIQASEPFPQLPAAIEVAAFRIAQEAITNVIRHAQARHCMVTLAIVGLDARAALALEVHDDGTGLPANHRTGVGLTAMRERAEQVGGTCSISTGSRGGTRVDVYLPIS